MRFVRQPLTHVINCDDRLWKMGDNAEKRKHGAMLPSTIRAIVCGSSNCGKSNVLISLVRKSTRCTFRERVRITRNRCNSRNINTWRICYHRSTKSAILHSLIIMTSFHRARHVQTQSSSSMV